VKNADESASVISGILRGENGPARDIALLNAAAALTVAGHSSDMAGAMNAAARAIDSGAAKQTLENLVRYSTEIS